jgi:hypothetical protein
VRMLCSVADLLLSLFCIIYFQPCAVVSMVKDLPIRRETDSPKKTRCTSPRRAEKHSPLDVSRANYNPLRHGDTIMDCVRKTTASRVTALSTPKRLSAARHTFLLERV